MRAIYLLVSLLILTACSTTTVTETEIPVTRAASHQCIDNPGWAYSANRGADVYLENCSYCHQADGSGQAGQVPQLAGNAALMADPARGIRMILVTKSPAARIHGMEVQDMVAIFEELDDGDIADVMTYVLSSWGNCTGPIFEDEVDAVAVAMGGR